MTKITNGDMLMVVTTLISIICIAVALVLAVTRKVYGATPPLELKRRAAQRNQPANQLFRAVAYGNTLEFLLWAGIAVFGAIGLVLLAQSTSIFVSVPIIMLTLSLLFIWLPASRVTKLGTQVTLLINPTIVWLLSHLHPVLSRLADLLEKRYVPSHTGIYERSDIIKLINQQADQQDSRLSIEELAIVQRALTFGDYLVRDIATPRADIAMIGSQEILGPVVIDELHKTTAPFILVADKAGQIVGSLEARRLGLQSSGPAQDYAGQVYFLHESDTLREALHAFFVTNYPMFVVVNSFEEYVGIVTIESVLRQLLGHLPGDEFEQYTNLAAVAARHPRVETPKTSKIAKKSS